MRRAYPLLLLLVVSLFFGCQPQETKLGLKRREREYKRVVSLAPGTTEIIFSTLTLNNLVGLTSACDYPEFSVKGKTVVAGVKPDYEKLKSVNPDFIVYDGLLYSQSEVDKLKETGATLFGFTAKTIDEFEVQLFELANFVGRSSRVSEYMDKIRTESATAQTGAPEERRKVAIIMPGANGASMILGTGSFLADVVKASGGIPVGPEADRFVPLSPEALVELDPDAIIVPAKDAQDQSGVLSVARDSRYKGLKAIKDGRIGAIRSDVLLRMGSRVDTLIKAIARIVNR
jgi:iron complex transport system substrate-binding protein